MKTQNCIETWFLFYSFDINFLTPFVNNSSTQIKENLQNL